jgi:NAD(P)-dependent dehydrogenase (short-subunit alcohol dehydrogenase family)
MSESFDFPDDPVPPVLEDNTIIVAGGGRGIGKATAVYLGDAGANVVVNRVSENPEVAEIIRDRGGEAIAHNGDISSLEYTEELVADTADEYGQIDGVINYAGILRDSYLLEMSGEEWDQVMNVHLRGHFSLLRNTAQHWKEQADGDALESQRSFVTVTSRQALGSVGQLNYATAKAGILGMTWTAASELSRYNVRVNSLMPLAFTEMIAQIPEEKRPPGWTRERMPPGKVAPVAAYLLSDEAEDVNGQIVRSHADLVARISEPEINPRAYREGGWTFETLAERFSDTMGADVNLDRTE